MAEVGSVLWIFPNPTPPKAGYGTQLWFPASRTLVFPLHPTKLVLQRQVLAFTQLAEQRQES